MKAFLSGLLRDAALAARSLIFAEQCALCQAGLVQNEDKSPAASPLLLCAGCLNRLPRLTPPLCLSCGEPVPGSVPDPFICQRCLHSRFAFDFARAAYLARGGLRELVHRFKYEGALWLAPTLAQLLTPLLRGPEADPRLQTEAEWMLVPVPLHPRRQREREYNQAEELAAGVARLTGWPLVRALRRQRYTSQQAKLDRAARLHNLRDSFRLHRAATKVRGQAVLLIDDVLTTGSTAQECAHLLRHEAGARRVAVLTLARG